MNQELINELNKRIIDQFEEVEKDLANKIEILERSNAEVLSRDTLEGLAKSIDKLREAKEKISEDIVSMKAKSERGESLFVGKEKTDESILSGSKYETKFETNIKSLDDITEEESKLNESLGKIDSMKKSKIVSGVKRSIEKRIETLQKKQGKIANKQRKIVDKVTKEKLKEYSKDSSRILGLASKLEKSNEQKNKDDEKLTTLVDSKQELSKLRENLLASNSLGLKLEGTKILFNEKLTEGRIYDLRKKSGIVNNISAHTVMRGVKPSLIERMKDKVKTFGNAVSASFKEGIETFKSFYEEPESETSGKARA